MTEYLPNDTAGHLDWDESMNTGFDNVYADVRTVDATATQTQSEVEAARDGESFLINKINKMDELSEENKARLDAGYLGTPAAYSSTTTYNIPDMVFSNGIVYTCLQDSTLNVTPGTDSDVWLQVTGAIPDLTTVFNEQWNKLVSGESYGTEGKWVVALNGTIDVDGYFLQSVVGSSRTLLSDSTVANDSIVGSASTLDVTSYGIVWGDSGEPYLVHHIAYASVDSSVRNCALNPKHGDVRDDFTIGNTYPVLAFKESTDVADQQTGNLDVTDVMLGKKRDTADIWTTDVCTTLGCITGLPYWYNNNTATINFSGQTITVTGAAVDNYVQLRKTTEFDIVVLNVTNNGTDSIQVSGGIGSPVLAAGGTEEYKFPAGRFDLATMVALNGSDLDVTINTLTETTGTQWTNVDLESVMPLDSFATLNAGYFSGKTWTSQLLSDVQIFDSGTTSARITPKLSRPLGSIASVEVLKSDGNWQAYTFGDPTTAFGYAGDVTENWCALNVGASYAALGYTSEAEMLEESAVRVKYTTMARRAEPVDNPEDVVILGKLWTLQSYLSTLGRHLAWELCGFVDTSSVGSPLVELVNKSFVNPDTSEQTDYFEVDLTDVDTTPSNRARLIAGLYRDGGTYKLVIWSKEMISDTDWGDSNQIDIVDKRLSDFDENGNVIYVSCMSYDTGRSIQP